MAAAAVLLLPACREELEALAEDQVMISVTLVLELLVKGLLEEQHLAQERLVVVEAEVLAK